ncbi:hypothetical protein, partial [Escherichia coli]|uniref:hypothetical protein n=1 Tax=Escherichia coli TaxID=562 RepID=UPI00201F6AF1
HRIPELRADPRGDQAFAVCHIIFPCRAFARGKTLSDTAPSDPSRLSWNSHPGRRPEGTENQKLLQNQTAANHPS